MKTFKNRRIIPIVIILLAGVGYLSRTQIVQAMSRPAEVTLMTLTQVSAPEVTTAQNGQPAMLGTLKFTSQSGGNGWARYEGVNLSSFHSGDYVWVADVSTGGGTPRLTERQKRISTKLICVGKNEADNTFYQNGHQIK